MTEWGLLKAVAKALGEERFCSKAALLGLTEEDIRSFELKPKGEMAALRTPVGQLQAEGGGGGGWRATRPPKLPHLHRPDVRPCPARPADNLR